MQLLWGLLALSLLLGSSAGRKQLPPGLDPRSYWIQGPGDHFTPHFFEWVGSNPDLVSNIFFKHIPRDGRSSALDSFSPPESRDETCNGCILAVELIKLVIALGLEYEDIEDVAIEICGNVLEADGYRGDIICPGVVQNYGPHLFTIFRETTQDGRNICEMFDYCVPEAAWIEAENTDLPYLPRKSEAAPPANLAAHMKTASQSLNLPLKQAISGVPTEEANAMIQRARGRMAQMGLLQDHDALHDAAQSPQAHLKHRKRIPRKAEDTIRIAHISDVHVESEYLEGSATECGLHVCCRGEANGTGSAGPFGDFRCNVPPSTVEMWLQHVATLQPDLIIYTGDSPAHALWAETVDRQHNASRWLAEKIAEYMPGVPAYTTIGNHEMFPANLYFAPRPQIQELHQVLRETWGVLSGWEDEQVETFYDAGYFSQLIRPGLRILSWNANYGFRDNWYNILNQDQPELERMKSFVEETLITAEENNEKVIALTHQGSGGLSYYGDWDTQVMLNHSGSLVMRARGHSHGDGFQVFLDPETGAAQSVELSAPSSNTYSDINPGVRLYYLDADTFDLLDYDQYFLFLGNEDGMVEDPEIALMYVASEEYAMANLSAASYLDLVHRMEDDDEIFDRYYANKRMRTVTRDCSGDCKTSELCGLTTPSCNAYLACLLHTVGVDTKESAGSMQSFSVLT